MVMRGFPWRFIGRRFSFLDFAVLAAALSLIYALVGLGSGIAAPTDMGAWQIDLSYQALPYYAGRSLLRMFIALALSLIFSLVYGSVAAKNKRAERVLLPLLDVLQSVPVLGFLSAVITAFLALFPHSMAGVEAASIFAIFTSQAWNMTFSFYQSLVSLPADLREVSNVFGLSRWQRFWRLEVSYSMLPLVWNSMMSFGGGWFFLAASEAISVLNHEILLPGLGSYLSVALERQNTGAVLAAIATMISVIVLVDQLFWRPIVAWAQRFKVEMTASVDSHGSLVLTILQRSALVAVASRALSTLVARIGRAAGVLAGVGRKVGSGSRVLHCSAAALYWAGVAWLVFHAARYAVQGVLLVAQLTAHELLSVVSLGLLTFSRVLAATLFGLIWTVPVGVAMGMSPRLSRIAQPLVQIAASFPANMAFPFITVLYLRLGIGLDLGSIPLMMLGTQWYILFNVIAGAMAIPADLIETANVLRLRGLLRWRRLILPGIFPSLVTGCVTAWGGAWNASIVAEIVSWGDKTLEARGLGAYIARTTATGDLPGIVWGITVMSLFVVMVNRLVWRRLYTLAETKYRIV